MCNNKLVINKKPVGGNYEINQKRNKNINVFIRFTSFELGRKRR